VYRVYWRRKITDYLEDYLVQNHFPAPTQFVGVDEYLDQVANSEQNDCSTRVKAAMDLASLRNAYDVEIQFGIQLYLASEDALKRYARRFPLPARQDDEWDDD
jgi:hypothetical protein